MREGKEKRETQPIWLKWVRLAIKEQPQYYLAELLINGTMPESLGKYRKINQWTPKSIKSLGKAQDMDRVFDEMKRTKNGYFPIAIVLWERFREYERQIASLNKGGAGYFKAVARFLYETTTPRGLLSYLADKAEKERNVWGRTYQIYRDY